MKPLATSPLPKDKSTIFVSDLCSICFLPNSGCLFFGHCFAIEESSKNRKPKFHRFIYERFKKCFRTQCFNRELMGKLLLYVMAIRGLSSPLNNTIKKERGIRNEIVARRVLS
ncbi:CLUMA_CG013027, isoform A [Clunio marinus]|uniref:CLUMA_CG013027, isoform A n=1 Tax=Clunio marinus TaxID=568069 RepID=A0A1J1IJD4_9DIPT|nr:CLUMA_CG013027, isoform A [Clunio marinus]